jgi:hypothetical protein
MTSRAVVGAGLVRTKFSLRIDPHQVIGKHSLQIYVAKPAREWYDGTLDLDGAVQRLAGSNPLHDEELMDDRASLSSGHSGGWKRLPTVDVRELAGVMEDLGIVATLPITVSNPALIQM